MASDFTPATPKHQEKRMKNAFHTISFVRPLRLSLDTRNQPPRTSGSKLLSAWRVLPLAALALLCGRPPAVWAQAKPVPGGYVQLYPGGAAITQGQTVQLRAAVMNPLGFELPNRKSPGNRAMWRLRVSATRVW